MTVTVGSLFTGYGGLDLAVDAVLGPTETAWVSDVCKVNADGSVGHTTPHGSPCAILERRFPGVPNLGDITKVDWTTVPRVDVLTGGFPCQDLSHAGKRLGMRPETRSGLWAHMAYAIDKLRPALVVAENVRGLLSGEAHSDVEPCPWCMGDRSSVSALRALGAVLGDLADLGYDAEWVGVPASAVWAPRMDDSGCSLLPTPMVEDAVGSGGRQSRTTRQAMLHHTIRYLLPTPEAKLGESGPDYARAGRATSGGDDLATSVARLFPTPTRQDGSNTEGASQRERNTPPLSTIDSLLPTPTARDHAASGGSTPGAVTLTDAVIRTNLGTEPNPRHLPTPRATRGGSATETVNLLPTPNPFHAGNTETPDEWRKRRLDVIVASIEEGDPLTPDRYMPDDDD